MNLNRINNIISGNGINGWVRELAPENDQVENSLKKTFEFNNFAEAQYFVQEVGKFADANDHHPEWSVLNGGKFVSVRLTSHFAENTVTISDYELAQEMNTIDKRTGFNFDQYPRFTESQWNSFTIGVAGIVIVASVYKFSTASFWGHNDVQRGKPLPKTIPGVRDASSSWVMIEEDGLT